VSAIYLRAKDALGEGYLFQLPQGPIIRISPTEIHINDPDYMDEIYAPIFRKRKMYSWIVASAGSPSTAFSTADHELHLRRWAAISPFFSKEPMIKGKIQKLLRRLYASSTTGEVIRLDHSYTALTMNIIVEYSSGKCDNYLDHLNFKKVWAYVMRWLENAALIPSYLG
jgi:hypothetical protein